MSLSILLVDDESGIREGLLSYLQLKGYRVRGADSRGSALSRLREETFDLVITDWHLGDGTAEDVVEASAPAPIIVMSGMAEKVPAPAGARSCRVLAKPVLPSALLETLQELAEPRLERPQRVETPRAPGPFADLPQDTTDRVRLLLRLCRAERVDQWIDDGTFITVGVRVTGDTTELLEDVERLGGDHRVLERRGETWLEFRCYRDGRSDQSVVLLKPEQEWPREAAVAVDFTAPCTPRRFVDLCARAAVRCGDGQHVEFLNVPSDLRLYAEVCGLISGTAHDMPKRGKVGPRLPEVLNELWR